MLELLAHLLRRLRDGRVRERCGTPVWFRCQVGVPAPVDADRWLASLIELAVGWLGAEPESIEAVRGTCEGQHAWLCRFSQGQAALLVLATVPSPSERFLLCDALGQHGAVYLEEVPVAAGWTLEPLPAEASPVGNKWVGRVVEVIGG